MYTLLLSFFGPEKVLTITTGWDTLPLIGNYSYGGLPRKKFLAFHAAGKKITADEYHLAMYGTLTPSWDKVAEKIKKSDLLKKILK